MIKLTFIYFMIILLIGCKNSNQKIQKNDNENTDANSILKNAKLKTDIRENYNFDNSVIPEILIEFYKSIDTTLRLPTLDDYDDYYFDGYYDNKLPYFCSGYFNNDTILDYGLVLIKDTTEQRIYSFHTVNDTFIAYLLNKRKLTDSESKKFKAVALTIQAETNRTLEAIDTTYILKTDAISINDMDESSEWATVWDDKSDKYVNLWFD